MFLHAIFFLIGVSAATAAVEPLRIDGLVAAVFTPFDRLSGGGALNLSVVPEQEKYLNATGVDYVFVGGTTGESLSLTVDERKQLAEAWMATSANVIVHVGAEAVSDARELASHAERIGALAIGAMPPVFFSPANAQVIILTRAAHQHTHQYLSTLTLIPTVIAGTRTDNGVHLLRRSLAAMLLLPHPLPDTLRAAHVRLDLGH
jgi:hypothetical protein